MKFSRILKASNTQQIDAVIEGLPVNANGYFLTEEQMTAIETSLESTEIAAGASAQRIADLEATTASHNDYVTASSNERLVLTQRVAALETELADERKKPAGEMPTTTKEEDKAGKEKVAAHADPESPINKLADSLMGKPKAKTN